jgi:hypothetical protein
MRSLRTRSAALVAALALIAAAPAASVAGDSPPPPQAVAAKSCPAGYVHASLSWGHKCLREGQFCKKDANREYHRYDFHCARNGRLRDY